MSDTNQQDNPDSDHPPISGVVSTITREGRRPFYTTDTGEFVIPDDLTEEEFIQGLKDFRNYQAKGKLYFAKYLTYGEVKFGTYSINRHLGQLEFDLPSVSQALLIMSIPDDMHYPNLNAEHYVAIARVGDLTKAQKGKWARIASEQNLSPSTLRASIEAGEVVSPEAARKNTHGIISVHGLRAEWDIWFRRVGGLEGILKQDKENVLEIMNEIAPIAELHTKLGLHDKGAITNAATAK